MKFVSKQSVESVSGLIRSVDHRMWQERDEFKTEWTDFQGKFRRYINETRI
jgi:hypothetical protein